MITTTSQARLLTPIAFVFFMKAQLLSPTEGNLSHCFLPFIQCGKHSRSTHGAQHSVRCLKETIVQTTEHLEGTLYPYTMLHERL